MKLLKLFIRQYLHINKIKNKTYIFCEIRKKFYLFNKEEVIRQYIIFLLKKKKHYKNSNIWVEYSFQINKLNKRLDILVQLNHQPHILIECKSPTIPITQKIFNQIVIYNYVIKSPFLMISNGIKNIIFKIDKHQKKFSFLKKIPDPY
ncbi:type I restriction enzyme HsdR N-terminal domain-containing protein [Blattabacterium cuenoti]|uniref:type I restriction enzyme HsdR N-terminal domain-containing protein n=1 Tax=Blattabacterium cuenoti TaxID=1653831 RepID=UPI00163D2A58|nr:type I restriction enzyme HsdR N-terminal domain-containing protein [Blattabacterium cuenoti]